MTKATNRQLVMICISISLLTLSITLLTSSLTGLMGYTGGLAMGLAIGIVYWRRN